MACEPTARALTRMNETTELKLRIYIAISYLAEFIVMTGFGVCTSFYASARFLATTVSPLAETGE